MKGLPLLKAVKAQMISRISVEEANLGIYMENPVGIGEHSNLVEEVDGFVDRLAEAHDKLGMVEKLIEKFESGEQSTKWEYHNEGVSIT